MKKNITSWLCSTVAVLACATSAYATNTGATLFLWDNTGDQLTVADGSANDALPTVGGVVGYSGALGANWSLVVDTGTSKPLDGSATHPLMDLSFNHLSSVGAGTITVAFFDNAFGPVPLLGTLAQIGGTLPGGASLTYSTYREGNNTTPGFSGGTLSLAGFTQLTTQTFTASGSFSGNASGGSISGGANPFSLLQVITLTVGGASQATGNATLQAPDGGMTLMLLGSSLTALGLLRRTLKRN